MNINESIANQLFVLAKSLEITSRARVVAAIVKRNKIISFGYNHNKSHTFQAKYSKNKDAIYFHAEIHAIKNALNTMTLNDLSKCDIYVVRAKTDIHRQNWSFGLAKPCKGCFKCISEFELKHIIYSTDENTLIKNEVN